jgi:4-hydroxythreonine-4-phosphate dehydrogenase
LAVALAQRTRQQRLVLVADEGLLKERAGLLDLPLELIPFDARAAGDYSPGRIECLSVPMKTPAVAGQLNPAHASYVLETLRQAVTACQRGEAAALVTGPVHKGNINRGGFAFSGHTEFLAELTGGDPLMLLATPQLRVALATTHLPLSQVSAAITAEGLERVIRILWQGLRERFHLPAPNILVCGLNPHAGEDGHLGREELDVMIPVLDALRAEGMALQGPVPADTAFVPNRLAQTDAVLAMYHDQGLPVLKHLGFGRAVNATLGLPIVRTSVDHGTALGLAGTGQADGGSLDYAIQVAVEMVSDKAA